jgi:hypothetical protein
MLHKTIGFYPDVATTESSNEDRLLLFIQATQIVCMLQSCATKQILGCEFFKLVDTDSKWDDVFSQLKRVSDLLKNNVGKIYVVHENTEAVLIPTELFSSNSMQDYLKLVYGVKENSICFSNELKHEECIVNVFRVDTLLYEPLCANFNISQHFHSYTNLLQQVFQQKKYQENNWIKLVFDEKYFIVTLIKDNQLQLIQTFNYQSSEDILYHIMNVLNQHDISITSLNVLISGKIDLDKTIYHLIQQYFSNIEVEKSESGNALSEKLSTFPSHYFTSYFNVEL